MNASSVLRASVPTRSIAAKAVKGGTKSSKTSTSTTKGWLGSAETAVGNLDNWYGPNRKLFLPSGLLDRTDVPSYLTGELPGDYGYDPLGLGQDPAQVQKYRANELLHARWAMLAAAGIIIPEGLEANLNYFAVPWGVISNPLPLVVVIAIEVGLMGAVERYRASGEGPAKGYAPGVGEFDESIFQGMDPLYPGGPFDPLGLSNDPEVFAEMKVKEIKNGRLAMVSVLGFAIQGLVTG